MIAGAAAVGLKKVLQQRRGRVRLRVVGRLRARGEGDRRERRDPRGGRGRHRRPAAGEARVPALAGVRPPARSSPTRRCTTRPIATWTGSGCARTNEFADVVDAAHQGARVGPAALHLVRRRHAERQRQLPRPPRRRPGAATRSPTTSCPSRSTRPTARSPTPSCSARCAGSRTACARSASARATSSASTWAWCPSSPVAMLACARIGAPHVVVFGGFSAEALGERLESTGAQGSWSPRTRPGARAAACR